jgi:hypothetical protein
MSSMTRASTALVLALAIGALASVVDGCIVFCIAQRPASPTAPATCHHAGNSAIQIGRVPARCTHTHTGIVATIGKDQSRSTRTTSPIAVIAFGVSLHSRMFPPTFHSTIPPRPPSISLDRPVALRI